MYEIPLSSHPCFQLIIQFQKICSYCTFSNCTNLSFFFIFSLQLLNEYVAPKILPIPSRSWLNLAIYRLLQTKKCNLANKLNADLIRIEINIRDFSYLQNNRSGFRNLFSAFLSITHALSKKGKTD